MKIKNLFTVTYLAVMVVLFALLISSCSTGIVKNNSIVESSDGQFSLAVVIKAKAGSEDKVRNAVIDLLKPTQAEKGCIIFTLHEDPNDKSRFMFFEIWESKELWDIHLNAPHIKAFGENFGDLLAEPLDVTNWKIYQ